MAVADIAAMLAEDGTLEEAHDGDGSDRPEAGIGQGPGRAVGRPGTGVGRLPGAPAPAIIDGVAVVCAIG